MSRTNNICRFITESHQTRTIGLVVFCLMAFCCVQAGDGIKKHKVKNVQGTYIGGPAMSPEEVVNRAIDEAKKAAMSQAGIQENIASFQSLLKFESSGKYEEMFQSDVLLDIQGTVTDIDIIGKPVRELTPDGGTKAIVTMNCTVLEYENKRDPEFDAWIDGIKPVYKNNDGMMFTIKPSKDSYVRIFFVSDKSESNLLFPSEYEADRLFKASTTIPFPVDAAKFESYPVSTEFQQENFKVIFVFLKKNIPYTEVSSSQVKMDEKGNNLLQVVSYKNIYKWISGIAPDQRVVKTVPISIHK